MHPSESPIPPPLFSLSFSFFSYLSKNNENDNNKRVSAKSFRVKSWSWKCPFIWPGQHVTSVLALCMCYYCFRNSDFRFDLMSRRVLWRILWSVSKYNNEHIGKWWMGGYRPLEYDAMGILSYHTLSKAKRGFSVGVEIDCGLWINKEKGNHQSSRTVTLSSFLKFPFQLCWI